MKTKRFYSKMLVLFIGLILGFSQIGYSVSWCIPTVANYANFQMGMTNVTMTGYSVSFTNTTNAEDGTSPVYNDYSATKIVNGHGGDNIPFSVTLGNSNSTCFRIYIDWNNDGTFNTTGTELVYTSSIYTPSSVITGSFTVPCGLTAGNYRIRVSGDYGGIMPGTPPSPCSNQYGEFEDYTFTVLASPSLDIAMTARTAPAFWIAGNDTLTIQYQNKGTTTINTANFGYKLDNATAVVNSGITISGGLTTCSFKTYQFSPLLSITAGNHTLKVWVSNPNGVSPDGNPSNDTMTFSFCTTTSGSFVIDAGGTGNFLSFNAALNSLTCGGVNGPVTFTVKPGTYNERLVIPPIYGASATNTIKFIGSGTSSTTLTWAGTSQTTKATVVLNGANYITFKKMKIANTGSSYATAIYLCNYANYNTFDSCYLAAPTGGTSNWNVVQLSGTEGSPSSSGYASYNKFTNSTIYGGYYGVWLYGYYNGTSPSVPISTNNTFNNDIFSQQYYYGFYNYYMYYTTITNSTISNFNSNTSSYGIYGIENCYTTINSNYIQAGMYGIFIEDEYGTSYTYSQISNNMVSNFNYTSYQYGIYIEFCYYVNVYHNSVWTQGTSSGDYTCLYAYYIQNCNVLNNIFYSTGSNYPLYWSPQYSPNTIDYNDYWTTSSILMKWTTTTGGMTSYPDLKTFQAAVSGYNTNSYQKDPGFVSYSNLHLSSSSIPMGAPYLAAVPYDIDGQTRGGSSANYAIIGADEVPYPYQKRTNIASITQPALLVVGSNTVAFTIKNNGYLAIPTSSSIPVRYTIDSAGKRIITVKENFNLSSAIPPFSSKVYTFNTKWLVASSGRYNLTVYIDTSSVSSRDSMFLSMYTALAGTYYIDQSKTIPGSFANFTDAVTALTSGIVGSVRFIVTKGSYPEQIIIPNITGSSVLNTISFESQTGNNKDVVLFNTGASSTNNYVIRLNGGSYITFKNMSIASLGTSAYHHVIELYQGSSYNTFSNDIIYGINVTATPTYPDDYNVICTPSQNGSLTQANCPWTTITGCKIMYGTTAIKIYGTGNPSSIGLTITNNTITSFYNNGIWGEYLESTTITNNIISNNGSATSTTLYGVYLYNCDYTGLSGTSNGYPTNGPSLINNNTFTLTANTTTYGIYMYYCSYGYNIMKNTITLQGSLGSYYGIYFQYCYSGNGPTISKNKIYVLASGTGTNSGIYTYYIYGSPLPALISDNFIIQINGTGTNYGINYQYNPPYAFDIYHNSINITGGNTSSAAIYLANTYGSTSATELRNNILAVTGSGGGYAIYNSNTSYKQLNVSDHNDLYVSSTSLYLGNWGGTNCGNLASWQTNSGMDANSVSVNPGFASINLLYPSNPAVNFAIAPLSQVPDDIDGTPWVNPITAGAAHLVYKLDAGVIAITNPTSPGCAGYTSVGVRIRNYGATIIDSVTVNWSVDGVTQTPYPWKNHGTLSMLTDTSFFIGNYNFTPGHHSVVAYTSRPNGGTDLNTANDTDSEVNMDIIAIPGSPTVYNNKLSPICGGGSTVLTASGAQRYTWWSAATGGNVLSRDSFYVTPPLKTKTIYYVSAGSVGAPSNLTTKISGGTAADDDGFMFNVTAKKSDINIDSFDVIPSTSGQYYTVEVYYRPGTYVGYGGISSAWTLLGSVNIPSSNVSLTHIPVGLMVPKGQTYGVYITSNNNYLSLHSVKGNNTYSDTNLTLTGGTTIYYPFDTSAVIPSMFAGGVYYEGNSLCNSARVPDTALVNPMPVTAFTVNSLNQCIGSDKYVFTNTTTSSDSLSSCVWDFGDGTTATLTGPVNSLKPVTHVYSTTGTLNVILTSSSVKGCIDSFTQNVTINKVPIANAGGSIKYTLCGDTAFLGTTSTSTYKYHWYPATNLSDTTKSAPYSLPTGNITYYLTVTDINSGCKASDSISLKITNAPKANAGKDQSICLGKSVTLTATGGAYCLWNTGDATYTIVKSPNVTTPYIVTVFNAQGCSGKDTVMVYVYTYPVSGFNVANNIECLGGNLFTFTNTTTNNSGGSYLWRFGDGNTSTKTSSTHSYTKDGSYDVMVVAINTIGCRDSTDNAVYVNPNPVPKFSVNDSTQCQHGNSFIFTNNTSINSGAFSSQWYFGDGNTSNQTSPSYSYTAPKVYSAKLVATSDLGCIDSLSKVITVNPSPIAGFTIDKSTGCFDTSFDFNFTNTSTISSGSLNYLWKMGDNSTANNSGQFPHHYLNPGTFNITLISTSNMGCVDTITKTVKLFLKPSVDLSPHSRQLKPDSSVVLDAGSGFAHYNWFYVSNLKSFDTTQTVKIDSSFIKGAIPKQASFGVQITDKNGCQASDAVSITFTNKIIGIKPDGNNNPGITIYPNPSNGKLFLSFRQLDNEEIGITVMNAQGQMIYNQKTKVTSDASTKELDFSNQGKGVYFIRFDYKGQTYNSKFIIN